MNNDDEEEYTRPSNMTAFLKKIHVVHIFKNPHEGYDPHGQKVWQPSSDDSDDSDDSGNGDKDARCNTSYDRSMSAFHSSIVSSQTEDEWNKGPHAYDHGRQ